MCRPDGVNQGLSWGGLRDPRVSQGGNFSGGDLSGEVVDENYIADLVEEGKINYACDVLQNEQNIEELKKSRLYMSDKVVITPHIAGVTVDSQTKALEAILKLCMK